MSDQRTTTRVFEGSEDRSERRGAVWTSRDDAPSEGLDRLDALETDRGPPE